MDEEKKSSSTIVEVLQIIDRKWWLMLIVSAIIGVYLHAVGDAETARIFFGAILGQGASGGFTAFKPKTQP